MSDFLSYKATFKKPRNKYLKYFCEHPASEWSFRAFLKHFNHLEKKDFKLYKRQLLNVQEDSKNIPEGVLKEIEKLLKKPEEDDGVTARSVSPPSTINIIGGNNYVVSGDLIINEGPSRKKQKTKEVKEASGRQFRHVWKSFLEDSESGNISAKYSPEKNGVVRTAYKLEARSTLRNKDEKFNLFVNDLLNVTDDIEDNIDEVRSLSGLEAECRFTKKIFSTLVNFNLSPSMAHSEATFNNSLLFPCLLATIYLLRKKTVLGPVFVPGEEPLQAMSRVLDKKDGRKTYHADAIFRLENLSGLEVLLLETAGPFHVCNERKIAFDNTKGMFALLAMMKTVADTFSFASVNTFKGLKLYFVQASGIHIRLWSMRYLSNGLYEYNREDKVEVKEGDDAREAFIPSLDFFLNIQACLSETFTVLQKLKMEHVQNEASQADSNSQQTLLSDIICPDVFRLTYNTHGKGFGSRAINSSQESN